MTINFLDRCIFQATAGGISNFVVSGAPLGYMTPAQANAVNGATYHYIAQTVDNLGNIQQWEIGTGQYTVLGTTLSRTIIIFSSSSNTKVNFVKAPQILITLLAEDVVTGPTSSVANHAATFLDGTGKNLIDSKVLITPPATGATLTIADGKTFTASASITISGTDGALVNFGGGGNVLYNNPLELPKSTPFGAAPGAGIALIQAVAGTNPGTCKIIIYAGTSSTPITIVDNIGSGF